MSEGMHDARWCSSSGRRGSAMRIVRLQREVDVFKKRACIPIFQFSDGLPESARTLDESKTDLGTRRHVASHMTSKPLKGVRRRFALAWN